MSVEEMLASPILQVRIEGMEVAASDPTRWAAAVVATIDSFPNDSYFVYERIVTFGVLAAAALREMLSNTPSAQVAGCCQVCLAALGFADSAALLALVSSRSEWQYIACRHLAASNSPPIAAALLGELEGTSNAEDERAAALLQALTDLRAEVPSALRARLGASQSLPIRAALGGVHRPGSRAR